MAEKDLVFGIKIDSKKAKKSTEELNEALATSTANFSLLQTEVDKTNSAINNLQTSVDSLNASNGKLSRTQANSLKVVQKNTDAVETAKKALKGNEKLLKTNADRFKDLESSAEGSRGALQLFSEVILGIPGDAVTKLFDSFEILGEVIKKGFATSVATAQVVIKKFLVVLKQLTIAVITNPLFIKAAIIITGIVAIVVAIKDLEERLGIFTELMNSISAIFGDFTDDAKQTATVLEILGRTFKNIGILLVSVVLGPLTLVIRGFLELRKALTSDEETVKKLDKQIEKLDAKFIDLNKAIRKSVNELNPFTASANIAAEKTAKLNKELEKNQAALAKGVDGLTGAQIEVEIFGDKFDKAQLKLIEAQKAMKKANDEFGKAKEGEKPIKALTDASNNLFRSQKQLDKLAVDAFQELKKRAKQSEIELLKSTEKTAEARKKEHDAAIKELDLLESKLISRTGLTTDQIKELQALNKQIKENAKAQIDAIDAAEKKTKEAEDARKKKEETDKAIAKGGEVSALLEAGGEIATGLGGVLSDAVSGIATMLTQAAVDFGLSAAGSFITAILAIPDLLEGVAGFLDKITNIGPAIAEALETFANSVIGLISDFIPNLLKSIPKILDTLINGLLIGIPDAFLSLADQLPSLIDSLIEKIPELIEGLVRGFQVFIPKLVIAAVRIFGQIIPTIIPKIVKALPDIGEAIVVGFLEAFLEINELVQKLFSGEALTDSIGSSISEGVSEGLKASSSEVFQVLELEQERFAKGAGTFIVEATEKAVSIWRRFWQFVSKLWDGFIKILTQVWDTIILAVEGVFNFIGEKIFEPIIAAFERAFKWIKENVFDPFANALQRVFDFLADTFNSIIDGFKVVWEKIDELIISPLKSIIDGLVGLVAQILNPIITLLNSLKIPKLGADFKVLGKRVSFTVWEEFDFLPDIPKIAAQEGGLVPGFGDGDIVPALLEPGEFVLNRDAVDAIGIPQVQALNQGEGGMGVTLNFAPTINVTGGNFEPKQVIDDMFTELRRRSSNGTKVIFAQGIKT